MTPSVSYVMICGRDRIAYFIVEGMETPEDMRCPHCGCLVPSKDWVVGPFKCPSCDGVIRLSGESGVMSIIKG